MPEKKATGLTKGLEAIGNIALFTLRVIRDAFRAPFELAYVWQELADQGWRSLPLIVSSGLALGMVMTLHTRTELIKFGASAWIPAATVPFDFSRNRTPGSSATYCRQGRRGNGSLAGGDASDRTDRRD